MRGCRRPLAVITRGREKAHLQALIEGADWANMGKRDAAEVVEQVERQAA
jgi:hypothetical protein